MTRARRTDAAETAFQQLLDEGCTVLRLQNTARVAAQLYGGYFAQVDLTAPQFGTLAYLYRDGVHSVGTLAEAVHTDQTTLTRNLRLLEKRGLIAQTVAADDRRRREIRLTPDGKRLLQKALLQWQQAQAALTEKIGRTQTADLNRRLDEILRRIT